MSNGPETPACMIKHMSTGDGRKRGGFAEFVLGKDLKQGYSAAKRRK